MNLSTVNDVVNNAENNVSNNVLNNVSSKPVSDAVSPLSKWLGIVLIGALGGLAACGGGGSDSQIIIPNTEENVSRKPAQAATVFGGYGYSYQVGGNAMSEPLIATVNSVGEITLKAESKDYPELNYDFKVPSGFSGTPFIGGRMLSFSMGNLNKEMKVLAPSATTFVQNVFWRNLDNIAKGGFAQVGYLTDTTKLAWPVAGTAIYQGKAFQYLTEIHASSKNKQVKTFLFSSDITAVVDYAAKTLKIEVAPDGERVDGVENKAGLSPAQFVSSIGYQDFTYASRGALQPTLHNGLNLTKLSGDSINFFGENAEELGGFLRFDCATCKDNAKMKTQLAISFALRKQ